MDPPLFACRPKMQWRIQGGGGWQGWSPPPPLELVPILKTYAKCAWPGPITPPPLECGWRHTGNVQGGVCACECPSVRVFFNFSEGGWRHADNVQGGGGVLVNVFTPPPSKNPGSAPGDAYSLCFGQILKLCFLHNLHGYALFMLKTMKSLVRSVIFVFLWLAPQAKTVVLIPSDGRKLH